MTQKQDEQKQHPTVSEHPEQKRQQETGQEDASNAMEVGRPPSDAKDPKRREHAA